MSTWVDFLRKEEMMLQVTPDVRYQCFSHLAEWAVTLDDLQHKLNDVLPKFFLLPVILDSADRF